MTQKVGDNSVIDQFAFFQP